MSPRAKRELLWAMLGVFVGFPIAVAWIMGVFWLLFKFADFLGLW